MQQLSTIPVALILLCFWSLLPPTASAAKKSYIVYMGSHGHARLPVISEEDQARATEQHHRFLESYLGSYDAAKEAMFHSYNKYINGFAAVLDEEDAARIAAHPDVLSVFPDKAGQLHTTRSWDFMQLEMAGSAGHVNYGPLWREAKFGEDVIIANLDSGVWPESKSFSDDGYGPIPAKWRGICQNDTEHDVTCNKKLIGVRYFNDGYLSHAREIKFNNTDVPSPRDMEGHGSHTLSTAGGNFVPGASVFGVGNGTAKGGAPRARVAAYKVCWKPLSDGACFDADILQAFDHAIHDGVDVLTLSLGSPPADFATDSMAVGTFHAVKHGVAVVASAGNSGPEPATVSNAAPWMFTIAASTLDREFQASAELGNDLRLKGLSLSPALAEHKMYTLLSAADAAAANASATDSILCKPGTLDPKKVKGKILVCLRGENGRMEKGQQAVLAGAVGMILCNDEASGDTLVADPHLLPAVQINYADGQTVFQYLNSTDNPVGYITPPTVALGLKPAPAMAAFSSQGPNIIAPTILKPDITAPGVSVIAAYTEATSASGLSFDNRTTSYNLMSGTSMSCPHVAGVVALLRAIHPDWSQAALRSALMTTARVKDNTDGLIRNGSMITATPFNYGSGHIDPNRAMDPGLVYDASVADYLSFLCAQGNNATQMGGFTEGPYTCPESATLDVNYPSISVVNLTGPVTLTRKLKNVGAPGVYRVHVASPHGVSVKVHPRVLRFLEVGEEKSFKVTLAPKKHNLGQTYVFGKMTWLDGKHVVRSPIAANVLRH
uniref:Subtilisin-like protease SBT5.3 n=1 Tax=Kalanchoe fedtschenkoi TaxID=63787 RepID=A0A7N0UIF5_KALFE